MIALLALSAAGAWWTAVMLVLVPLAALLRPLSDRLLNLPEDSGPAQLATAGPVAQRRERSHGHRE